MAPKLTRVSEEDLKKYEQQMHDDLHGKPQKPVQDQALNDRLKLVINSAIEAIGENSNKNKLDSKVTDAISLIGNIATQKTEGSTLNKKDIANKDISNSLKIVANILTELHSDPQKTQQVEELMKNLSHQSGKIAQVIVAQMTEKLTEEAKTDIAAGKFSRNMQNLQKLSIHVKKQEQSQDQQEAKYKPSLKTKLSNIAKMVKGDIAKTGQKVANAFHNSNKMKNAKTAKQAQSH